MWWKLLVCTSNTKGKHNTKDFAIKTNLRPERSKKPAQNQENQLTLRISPLGAQKGVEGRVTEKNFFQKLPIFTSRHLSILRGPWKAVFDQIKHILSGGGNPPITVGPIRRDSSRKKKSNRGRYTGGDAFYVRDDIF